MERADIVVFRTCPSTGTKKKNGFAKFEQDRMVLICSMRYCGGRTNIVHLGIRSRFDNITIYQVQTKSNRTS